MERKLHYLFDADALLCLRSLGLLRVICASSNAPTPFLMTQYVARHELSTIADELTALESCGRLEIIPVEIRSPAGQRWRQMVREGVDKGEAESIAWALDYPKSSRPVLVTQDGGARKEAKRNKVPVIDIMDFVIELVDIDAVDLSVAREALSIWEDKSQQRCRPRDFTTFDKTYARRRAALAGR